MHLHKNIISLLKKKNLIYTKSKSSVITQEFIGKTVFIYNGNKLLEKKIDNFYLVGHSIGSLKNINTKKSSVFKSKKKKKQHGSKNRKK